MVDEGAYDRRSSDCVGSRLSWATAAAVNEAEIRITVRVFMGIGSNPGECPRYRPIKGSNEGRAASSLQGAPEA